MSGNIEPLFNRCDIDPVKRLRILFDKACATHVDDGIEVIKYYEIAEESINAAKKYKNSGNNEGALRSFLRYQTLIKKLKKHANYKDIPIGQRAAFDYKLKKVAKHIEVLTKIVLKEYEKFYFMTEFIMRVEGDGIVSERPTMSTIKSTAGPISYPERSSFLPKLQERTSEHRISSLNLEILQRMTSLDRGTRQSIFSAKQLQDFEEIRKQRRILRSYRTIILPSKTTILFSCISSENSRKNIETVAYLGGQQSSETELCVTHLVIPEQSGYSDYFKIFDSQDLLQYLEKNDLMMIGWIHSHPIETTYMTSCDMHYQGVFQSVLPEAIALVFSSREMRSKAFNLTDHGLKLISRCRSKGFHIHDTNPPLTMASHHITIDLGGELIVKDFRELAKDSKLYKNQELYGEMDNPFNYKKNKVSIGVGVDMSREEMEQVSKVKWDPASAAKISEHDYENLFERMLKYKPTSKIGSDVKIRKSEIDFVHLRTKE